MPRNIIVQALTHVHLVVDDAVDDDLLHRYVEKAIDNGFDNGLDPSMGVTVRERETNIQSECLG